MQTTVSAKTTAQGELLFNRLSKRYKHLKKWARRTGTNAFRLYDRDIPEIPLVLDLYDDAVSGALYRSSLKKDTEDFQPIEESWLSVMKGAASRALDIPENRIFLKQRMRMRRRQEEGTQYVKAVDTGRSFYRDVKEGDICFRVNLSDYLDTGLFLDSRRKRALIRKEAAGKRFLNLFAYTCSLSVAAAKGGALQADSVDLSNTYLEWGKINFAINKLDAPAPSFIRSDVMRFITQAARAQRRWDIIILDPPSFSNSKKMNGVLDIRRDHRELIHKSLSLLSPGGTLYFSSNAKGFHLDSKDFPEITVKDITKDLEDEDFKRKRIPVCYTLTRSI